MPPQGRTAPTDAGTSHEPRSDGETRALSAAELPSNAPDDRVAESLDALAVGETVGRYVVLEHLARGGMSIVYVAHDPELDRRVALKVMRPDAGERADKAQARLLREATAMARLAHPNVVRVYDVGTLGERVYMAMELVEGLDLRDWSTALPRSWRERVDVLVRAGRGLAAAHDAGLVHLDFKPRNVLVGKDGEVRVVDFGLARMGGTDSASLAEADALPLPTDAVTCAGVVMGTPGYMAPEQVDGTAPDARSDQFSFCVTAWEVLYGQRPYAGRRLDTYRTALFEGRLVDPPAAARVPPRLRRLLERGLALDPARRHPSLDALLDAMTADPWRRWRGAGLLGALAGTAALATWAVVRAPDDPCTAQARRLEDAWSPERREAVHARLSRPDAAPRMADEVVAGLDAYGAAWTDAAAEACRAARSEGRAPDDPYDVRGYCLDHRRLALRAAVGLALEPDAPADTRWDRVVAELPPVDACRDATSVHHVGRPPPSEDLRRTVAHVDEQLARAHALLDAGRVTDALAVLEPAVRAAELAGHGPTIAHAKLAQSSAYGMIDRVEEAERIGFEAMWTADVEGMHSVRLEAYSNLVFVVGLLAGRGREAESLGQTALWLESRLVHDPRVRARVLANLGGNDNAMGEHERARARFLEAMELRRAHGIEEASVEVATILQGLGGAYHQLGEHEKALETFRESRRLVQGSVDPNNPVIVLSWENEAAALHALERYEEAIAVLEPARVQLAEGHTDVALAPLDAILGAILIELRRLPEAEVALGRVRRALTAGDEDLRPMLLGITHGNLAYIELEHGRPAEAEAELALGLERLEATLGRDHVYYAWLLGLRARAELDRGKARAALEHAASSWDLLAAADARGDALVEPELRAEAALARARALHDPHLAADPELVARFGGGRTARGWAELAVREAEAGGRSAEPMLGRARAWLATLPPEPARDG